MKKIFTILTTLALLCAVGCEEQGDDNVNPNDKPNTEQPGEKPDDGSGDTEKPDDGSEIPDDAYISINKDILTFSPDGESFEIKVYSNYEWTLTNNCDWVTTSISGGEASEGGTTITLSADLTYDDREGTIIFSCGKAKKVLVVSQSFKEAIIADENNVFNVPAEGGNVIINYQTSVECEVIIPEEAKSWISLAPAETRGLVSYSTTLNVAENTTGERSAVVKVVAKNNRELMAEYKITQQTSYCIKYTSSDSTVITAGEFRESIEDFNPFLDALFGDANVVSNTYENGVGMMIFDRELRSIGALAFANIGNLTSITIPDSVTEIGYEAFVGCTSLTSFYGKYASEDGRCLIIDGVLNSFAPAGLTEYTFPDSVTSIGVSAFFGCSSLTSITIPDSVTWIGDGTFAYCTSLTSVTIPDSVTEIGWSAFEGCYSLSSITIPDGVTSIGGFAFYDCYSLTSVTIGNGVTEIGEDAFSGCTSLTSVTIGNGVTEIGYQAFSRCSSLTSVTIPDSVTEIGQEAFYECESLASVYCKATTPPSAVFWSDDWCAFDNNASERKIYVPTESVDAYKAADYWSDYADYIEPYQFE